MSGLPHVTAGQPFRPRASEWNTLLDSARTTGSGRVVVGQPPSTMLTGGSSAQGRCEAGFAKADNALTGVAFTFIRFVVDGAIDPPTTPKTLMEEVDADNVVVETEAVNRSTTLDAGPDSYVVCVKVNGEWNPVLVSESCPD